MTRGGGVCIYVRNDLCSMEVVDLRLRSDKSEQVWCGIKRGSDCILAGCIYREPSSGSEQNRAIMESLKAAKELVAKGEFKSLIVAGDFNFPDIQWADSGSGHTGKNKESYEFVFINVLDDSFLTQWVGDKTYRKGIDHEGSLLDLLITDTPERLLEMTTFGRVRIWTLSNHLEICNHVGLRKNYRQEKV